MILGAGPSAAGSGGGCFEAVVVGGDWMGCGRGAGSSCAGCVGTGCGGLAGVVGVVIPINGGRLL